MGELDALQDEMVSLKSQVEELEEVLDKGAAAEGGMVAVPSVAGQVGMGGHGWAWSAARGWVCEWICGNMGGLTLHFRG